MWTKEDTLEMTVGDVKSVVIVGGVLKHELFGGNYVVASANTVARLFGKQIDTVLVISDGRRAKRRGSATGKVGAKQLLRHFHA